jgi:hypothetical protein
MAICHNLDELSQEDAEAIVQALNGCAAKLGKIAQRLGDEGKTQFVEI